MQKSKKFIIEDKQGNNMYPATISDMVNRPNGRKIEDEFLEFDVVKNKTEDICVSVKEFGAKADGITDDSIAINEAMKYCENTGSSLYFPKGIYAVSSTINWSGKHDVYGDGTMSCIKAISEVDKILFVEKTIENIQYDNNLKFTSLKQISINGNNLANNGLYVKCGKALDIGNIRIVDCKDKLCVLGENETSNNNKVWESNIHHLHLNGNKNDLRCNICLDVRNGFVDSTIHDIVAINAKQCIINLSCFTTFISKIHTYCYPIEQNCEKQINITGASNILSDLYIDTPGKYGIFVDGDGNILKGIYVLYLKGIETDKNIAIQINKTNVSVSDVVVNYSTLPSEVLEKSVVIFVNNANNSIYDASVKSIFSTASNGSPKKDIEISGKMPWRFKYDVSNTSSSDSFANNQIVFTKDVYYNGQNFVDFKFKYPVASIRYFVNVEVEWDTSFWISDRTAEGFRVNFAKKPESSYKWLRANVVFVG